MEFVFIQYLNKLSFLLDEREFDCPKALGFQDTFVCRYELYH